MYDMALWWVKKFVFIFAQLLPNSRAYYICPSNGGKAKVSEVSF